MRSMLTAILVLITLFACISPSWCQDQDEGFRTFGIRGGISATPRDEFFHQYEIYTSYGLPWSVRWDSGWGLAMQLNMAAGALHAAQETGFIGALGPGVIFDKAGGKGVAIEVGGDLNVLSQDHFGAVSLNGRALFDGHIGVIYRFSFGPGIGYRFQHMSNAGLNGNLNTGLDLHMLELSWNLH